MQYETIDDLNLQYDQFLKMDYQSRVAWFDKAFKIIQYKFPVADADISWFFDEAATLKLYNIYYHEMHHNGMSKKVSVEGGEAVKFDIRPSSRQQRIFLNEYLMSHFRTANQSFYSAFNRQVESSIDRIKFLNSRMDKILTTIDWMNIELERKQKLTLKLKFLGIIYNGYVAFAGKNEKMITKRKLTELFLFNQGIVLAEHLFIVDKHLLGEQLSVRS